MIDAIRKPAQARSQRTMDEVYRALRILLRRKPFEKITISELASEAGVAVGSIYARFKDKNSLLAGLYLGVSEDAKRAIIPLSSPARWVDVENSRMVRYLILAVYKFYRSNAPVLRAVVIVNSPLIYDMRTSVWTTVIENLASLLIERMPERDTADIDLALRVITRFVTGVLHQAVLIDYINTWSGAISDRELIDQLTRFANNTLMLQGAR